MTARQPAPDPARAQAYARLQLLVSRAATDDEARALVAELRATARKARAQRWEPYPWQHPHTHPPGWVSLRAPGKQVCDERCLDLPSFVIPAHGLWLQRGGRSTGKTEGAAHYINDHAQSPPCDHRVPGGHRMTIVAPTQADAVASCMTGPSGVQSINPGVTVTTGREGTTARWPNGSVARLVGAHGPQDVERLRAWTNICCAYVEEAAAMPQLEAVLDQLPFTLRLGPRPHTVVATTPKNRPAVVKMIETADVVTWGRTRDATRVAPAVLASLETQFAGTRLGRQELDGELLEDVVGALWTHATLEAHRLRDPSTVGWSTHHPTDPAPTAPVVMERTVVAVDPAGGGKDSTGIVVVGTIGQHAYVLADLTQPPGAEPDTWARVAIAAHYDYGSEGLAVEHTFGGNMVPDVIHTRDNTIPIHKVPTKVGKRLRAEPVQAITEQGRLHMVGVHPELEQEMTGWVPDESPDSPDRLDALVHGVTYLLVRARAATVQRPRGRIR